MISTSLSLSSLQKDTKGYKKLASTNSQRTNLIFTLFSESSRDPRGSIISLTQGVYYVVSLL